MKLVSSVLIVLLMAGCASATNQIQSLKGQDISAAVQKWGPPDRKMDVGGRTYYYWDGTRAKCDWQVGVDASNKIVDGHSTGIDCFALGGSR